MEYLNCSSPNLTDSFHFSVYLHSLQSQVYRSQPDLVSAVYDTTASTLAVDYSYGQYPNQTDASQNYSQYHYPSDYPTESTWIAPEQRKNTIFVRLPCSH